MNQENYLIQSDSLIGELFMELPDQEVSGEFEKSKLIFYEGTKRRIRLIDEEVPSPDGRLILSRADLQGVIAQCSQSSVSMFGYSEAEPIG